MTEVFPIVPAQGRVMYVLAFFVFAVLVAVTVFMLVSARGGRVSRFEISSEGLRLRGDIYGRMIPASAIRSAEARVVDLALVRELQPRSRTAGTAVPGYHAGWFRLRNGEKALLYLTDRQRAVHVPTTAGYSLLLSPQNPERFVEVLQQMR